MSKKTLTPLTDDPPRRPFRFVLLTVIMLLVTLAMIPLDSILADPTNMDHVRGDVKRLITLSEIFAHGFGVAIIAATIWIFSAANRRFILRIVMCAIWPGVGVNLLKLLLARRRPITFFNLDRSWTAPANISDAWLTWMPNGGFNSEYYHQSFPSAHAATAWGLAIGLIYVFPKGRWLFITLALMASAQRVIAYAHWPTDVCCGVTIAFFMSGALTQNWGIGKLLNRWESRKVHLKVVEPHQDQQRAA